MREIVNMSDRLTGTSPTNTVVEEKVNRGDQAPLAHSPFSTRARDCVLCSSAVAIAAGKRGWVKGVGAKIKYLSILPSNGEEVFTRQRRGQARPLLIGIC